MKGSCLCAKVTYQIDPPFQVFQYCHCSRCRKFTGSAHAANIFVEPDKLTWLSGQEYLGRYEPEDTKYFATCFCKSCGSSLPWLAKQGKTYVIPAGTLDEDPKIRPQQNIFWQSKACWYKETQQLPKHDELPPRS
ncbi:GFA family protein [Thalassotalea sp. G2M2-11]|uniref:GFA family protein n=1 Tax=Thalassotalea sp. G2M2-11 TaxID=2787627 RepID=UPI0019D21F63|nr:GFA family protein [Thalassotalea sp. G2M2-11]